MYNSKYCANCQPAGESLISPYFYSIMNFFVKKQSHLLWNQFHTYGHISIPRIPYFFCQILHNAGFSTRTSLFPITMDYIPQLSTLFSVFLFYFCYFYIFNFLFLAFLHSQIVVRTSQFQWLSFVARTSQFVLHCCLPSSDFRPHALPRLRASARLLFIF